MRTFWEHCSVSDSLESLWEIVGTRQVKEDLENENVSRK